jgi:PAS domain S-box-containing protein
MSNQNCEAFLKGGGEMGERIRALDWSKTALGPVSGWSPALRSTVALLLQNRFPLILWWGSKFVQFYNDTYIPIPGGKHPKALGQAASECWSEIWHVIGPMIEAPFSGQPATVSDDLFLMINRKGFIEETHFKVAYSPVPDDTVQPTGVGGVLATVAETTEQVYGERQLKTLRELGARAAEAKTAEQACQTAAETLTENEFDVPFALFYLVEMGGKQGRLVASCGFNSTGSANPAEVNIETDSIWPLKSVVQKSETKIITDLAQKFGFLPTGRWSKPPHTAIALPLTSPEQPHAYGVLIAGLNPHRELNEGYRTFFELAANQVTTAIRNANAYQEEKMRAEALAEIDRAKTTFFSNVSHEFRTPLTLMLSPLEDLLSGKDGKLPAEEKEKLSLIHSNGLRLLKLVNNLLDFSRIEAGRVQAVYEPTDLAVYTAELAGVFQSAIEKAGLELKVDCPPLPQPVYIDKEMWEKIVLNLLSNAFKFTFEGEIAVSLQWCDDHVELDVKDTGIGIAPEEMPRLFERFHRIQGVKARTHEGTGIGLALVQELARLHGGKVQAVSKWGKGTTFTVFIPTGSAHLPQERIGAARTLASTALGADSFVEEALKWLPEESAIERNNWLVRDKAREPVLSDPQSNNPKVLVVDDNADMRHYIQGLLNRYYTVEVAANGQAALEAIQKNPPDLVLTDIMMPVMDGFQLLRALRDNPDTKLLPIILLSARAGEESRVEGLDKGADDYLIKPFNASELIARVRTHLELALIRKQAQEALRESEQTLKSFFDNPGIMRGIVEIVNDDTVRHIVDNTVTASFLRLTPEAIQNKLSSELGEPPDIIRLWINHYREALQTGKPVTFEYQDTRGDSIVWLSATVSYLRTVPSGQPQFGYSVLDITERKQIEEALAAVHRQTQSIIDNTPAIVYAFDLEERFVLANKAVAELLNSTPEQMIGKRRHDFMPKEDADWHDANDRQAIEAGRALKFEEYSQLPGRAITWLTMKFPLRDAQGRIYAVAGISSDISERKKTEEALRESEENYRNLFNNMSEGFAVCEMLYDQAGKAVDYCFLKVNPIFEKFLGLSKYQIIGKTIRAIAPNVQLKAIENFGKVVSTGEPIQFENFSLDLNKWFEVYAFRANPGQFGFMVLDITERKKAEEKIIQNQKTFSELVERAPFGIYVVDSQFRIAHMNTSSQTGAFKNVRPVIGRDFSEAMHILWSEPVAAEIIAHFRHTLDTGEPYHSPQFMNPRADADIVESYEWELQRIILPDGEYGVICYYFDSTKLREAEAALQKYAHEVETANKELEAFNYSVSHDLRQPLRALESFSDLLRIEYRDKLDENGRDYVNRIQKASQYMYQLTDDMLKLSRINRADMYRDKVNLSEMAQSILDELQASQPQRKVDVKITPNLMVSGDKNLLSIAIRNILENAWKFTGKCPQTQIEIGELEKDGEKAYFIRDNGIGFDMRFKDKLFQPFQKLTTEKSYPGTGIGLAIVQRVINRHGGRVWAESEPEKGATFYFTLG